MKKKFILVCCGLALTNYCLAQEQADAFTRFANKKIPVSMQNFSFFESFYSSTEKMKKFNETTSELDDNFIIDTISSQSFKAINKREYKDIDVVQLHFWAKEEMMFNSAIVTSMTITFKTKANCDAYLKKLGTPVTDTRWDFEMKKNDCKGVQVYKEGEKTIRINTFNDCGAG